MQLRHRNGSSPGQGASGRVASTRGRNTTLQHGTTRKRAAPAPTLASQVRKKVAGTSTKSARKMNRSLTSFPEVSNFVIPYIYSPMANWRTTSMSTAYKCFLVKSLFVKVKAAGCKGTVVIILNSFKYSGQDPQRLTCKKVPSPSSIREMSTLTLFKWLLMHQKCPQVCISYIWQIWTKYGRNRHYIDSYCIACESIIGHVVKGPFDMCMPNIKSLPLILSEISLVTYDHCVD